MGPEPGPFLAFAPIAENPAETPEFGFALTAENLPETDGFSLAWQPETRWGRTDPRRRHPP
jgi:hypothetical protein